MDKTAFPQFLIFDIYDIVSEFISVFVPGGAPLDDHDYVFIEEVLTILYPTFIDLKNFETALEDRMVYFADNTVHYRDDTGSPRLLMEAASIMAQAIMFKLYTGGAYVNGFFPYVFKQMTPTRALIFEFAPEYVGDRYCDPRGAYGST